MTSDDGTSIAVNVSGSGPSAVLVHGTSGSDFSWTLVRPFLERSLTVYAVQRRGRGGSGDHPDYDLQREAEDIAAVARSLDESSALVGHSFGANCCLEAALLTTELRTLVLYEPAETGTAEEPILQEVDMLIAAGRNEAALETYLLAAGISEEELSLLRSSQAWADRVSMAHTLVREDRATRRQRITRERFAAMTVPTLLLVGSLSPPSYRGWIEDLGAVLVDSTVHVLPGQGHAANLTAPELLAAEIAGAAH